MDITDAILKMVDGSDHHSIDDYQLADILAAIMQGADHPNMADVLKQLVAIVQFNFDFWKKVSANMELLRAKARCMHSYGINIDPTQLAFILLANIDVAASEDWSCVFCPALQPIRRRFTYNHAHGL